MDQVISIVATVPVIAAWTLIVGIVTIHAENAGRVHKLKPHSRDGAA